MSNHIFDLNDKVYTFFGQWHVNGNTIANLSAVLTTSLGAGVNGFPNILSLAGHAAAGTSITTLFVTIAELINKKDPEKNIILTKNCHNAILYGAALAGATAALGAALADDDTQSNSEENIATQALISGLTGTAIEAAAYGSAKLLGWCRDKYHRRDIMGGEQMPINNNCSPSLSSSNI